jgi:hypothetical protein
VKIRPLYDVSSLSTPSTYGPSTSTVQQGPQQQANSFPIAGQEIQGVQQGPQQQANSLPIPGQETYGAENNNFGMLQHSSKLGSFTSSFADFRNKFKSMNSPFHIFLLF